jgi:hypothetical protein
MPQRASSPTVNTEKLQQEISRCEMVLDVFTRNPLVQPPGPSFERELQAAQRAHTSAKKLTCLGVAGILVGLVPGLAPAAIVGGVVAFIGYKKLNQTARTLRPMLNQLSEWKSYDQHTRRTTDPLRKQLAEAKAALATQQAAQQAALNREEVERLSAGLTQACSIIETATQISLQGVRLKKRTA